MNEAVLCIGSNQEPRRERVGEARRWLLSILGNSSYSSIYETPEIHGIGRPYMNMVICGEVDLDLGDLNRLCKEYELEAGRDAAARQRGDVPVDIDVVIWNGEVIREKDYNQSFFQLGWECVAAEAVMPLRNR